MSTTAEKAPDQVVPEKKKKLVKKKRRVVKKKKKLGAGQEKVEVVKTIVTRKKKNIIPGEVRIINGKRYVKKLLTKPQRLELERSRQIKKIDKIFYTYAKESSDYIDPEGIEALCKDMEMDTLDMRLLILAWKMKAARQGYFSKDEFRKAVKSLGAATVDNLKKGLTGLQKSVIKKSSLFLDFYKFAFLYCLTDAKQKMVDVDSICALLEVVLGTLFRDQVDSLVEYLQSQSDYKGINMDQWVGIHRFFSEISFPDLKNYDPLVAWPLLLDNFVDWLKEKNGIVDGDGEGDGDGDEDDDYY